MKSSSIQFWFSLPDLGQWSVCCINYSNLTRSRRTASAEPSRQHGLRIVSSPLATDATSVYLPVKRRPIAQPSMLTTVTIIPRHSSSIGPRAVYRLRSLSRRTRRNEVKVAISIIDPLHQIPLMPARFLGILCRKGIYKFKLLKSSDSADSDVENSCLMK